MKQDFENNAYVKISLEIVGKSHEKIRMRKFYMLKSDNLLKLSLNTD